VFVYVYVSVHVPVPLCVCVCVCVFVSVLHTVIRHVFFSRELSLGLTEDVGTELTTAVL